MPVTIDVFQDNDDIFIYHFVGHWTWDEGYQAVTRYKEMVQSIEGRVDNIVDFRKSNVIPSGAVTHLQSIAKIRPEQTNLAVFISDNRFGHLLLNIASRLNTTISEKYKIVSTLEEAIEVIQSSREQDTSS